MKVNLLTDTLDINNIQRRQQALLEVSTPLASGELRAGKSAGLNLILPKEVPEKLWSYREKNCP